MNRENKDRTISGVATLLIMVAAALLCSFIGYHLPNPPIEEEGMGVAGEVLGEIEGFGNNDNASFNDNAAAPTPSSTPDESYTTGQEPTPVAKSTRTEDKPTPTTKPEPTKTTAENTSKAEENKQTEINSNALFGGKRNKGGSEGKGTASGSGQAGSADGTPGGQGGTGKGNGGEWSLGGRSIQSNLPLPTYTSDKNGYVVVRIKVDRTGKVVEVSAPEKGSKGYDRSMVNAAKQAARQAKFNADNGATEYQYGTITYKFIRQG
ncbi:MAG: hypothetical protein IJR26_06575 [Bacteroidales bacterium]|nr:hypothetical protein [Bacteroidales bacterium]